jgi:RNA polymerase sigma-70 factor (ECF subfamily)
MVHALAKGNKQVLKHIYNEYSGLFFTIARRYARSSQEAEDMVQESFVQIYRKAHTFSFNGSFEGWMKRVVVNKCLTVLKKKSLDMSDSLEEETQAKTAIQESWVVESMSAEAIIDAMQELPEGARVVLNLYVLDGFSHKEISERLGITESASRSQLTKARAKLKKILEEKELIEL